MLVMINFDSCRKRLQKFVRDSGTRQANDCDFWFAIVLCDENVVGDFCRVNFLSVIHSPQLIWDTFDLIRRVVDSDSSASAK